MPRPVVTAYTEQLYARLPERYRAADESTDWTTLRILSLLGDQAHDVEALLDRITDLVDPAEADTVWLPWLAQLAGVVTEGMTNAEIRANIAGAAVRRPGSTAATRAAAAALLSGTKRVDFYRHVGGDWRELTVAVYRAETPGVSYDDLSYQHPTYDAFTAAYPSYDDIPNDDVVERAVRAQKPAGIHLTFEVLLGATYDDLAVEFPTYDDLAAAFPTYDEMSTYVPGSS